MRRPWATCLAAVAVVAAAMGCDGTLAPDGGRVAVTDQHYLFDVYYVNFAWGYRLQGAYIDNRGNVVTYDHSAAVWSPEDPEHPTEAELAEKYSANADTVAVVAPLTLRYQAFLIGGAGAGPLSDPVQTGFDMGAWTKVAYRYDAAAERYERVLLDTAGDVTQTNLSPEASRLIRWLATTLGEVQPLD